MITKEKIELEIEAEEDLIFYIQQMDTQQIIDALVAYASGESIQDDEANLSSELQIVLEKLTSLEATFKIAQQSYIPPNGINEDTDDPFCDMFADLDSNPIQAEASKQEVTDWSIEEMHIC